MTAKLDDPIIPPEELEAVQAAFVENILPKVQGHARIRFRHLRRDNRDDAIAKAIGNAWKAYITLHAQGKLDGNTTGIVEYAVRHVKAKRDVTGQERRKDVLSRRHGEEVESLPLMDLIADNRRMTPAEAAAFRVDYQSWPAREKDKERERIDDLASGMTTTEAAVKHGVSEPAVSQWRSKARRSWEEYQSEQGRY